MMRYIQLNHAVSYLKPSKILEVGTWIGQRAIDMYSANPNRGMEYVGIDLWDNLTEEISARELNSKPRVPKGVVDSSLTNVGLKHRLYQGYSYDRLPAVISDYGLKSFPCIYIDGGHAVETIKGDLIHCLELVSPGGMIVLDDYYSEITDAFSAKWGCNQVLNGTPFGSWYLWPLRDPLRDGGFVQMAVIQMPKEDDPC
ncbi:MAG: class I SAM-dependent methyltransferase, partial [Nitrososphaera sp.]